MNEMEKIIICPYCFEQFNHTDVHFRLETVLPDDVSEHEIEREKDPQKKEALAKQYFFQAKEDSKYEEFWSKYNHTTELTTDFERRTFNCEVQEMPIIDPQSSEHRKYLQKQEDGDYFIYDGYGMVSAVRDVYKQKTQRRVCPHCHNPLPMGYGQHEVKFISVIGATGSGKTVYISQLLRNMQNDFSNMAKISVNPTDDRIDQFLRRNPVEFNVPLPNSTMVGRLAQPMTFDISRDGGRKRETFVIYDIAGEDCQDTNAIQRFGMFVQKSDGIIYLISPKQMGYSENGVLDNSRQIQPSQVLNTIYTTIVANTSDKCNKPIAVCISKSDCIAGTMEDPEVERIIKKNVERYCNPTTNEIKLGFNADEYNKLEMKLASMFDGKPIATELENNYQNFNYFAFSATGCAVDMNTSTPTGDPKPVRIIEPILWLLKRFGYIESTEPIRLPVPRGDVNAKVRLQLSFIERYILRKPDFRKMTPEEKESLWYEKR